MPETPQPAFPPEPLKARLDVQLALGQVHGALDHAVSHAEAWLPANPDAGVTKEDLDAAYREVCREFGVVQAALNTGDCDHALLSAGFGGAQGAVKSKGLWAQIRRFCREAPRNAKAFVSRMEASLRWGSTILGSASMALQGEAKRFPGAASALEVIREFVELVLNTASSSGREETTDAGRDRKPG